MPESHAQKEQYMTEVAMYALLSLAKKPDWTPEQHNSFFFKTMDKKFTGSAFQHFASALDTETPPTISNSN